MPTVSFRVGGCKHTTSIIVYTDTVDTHYTFVILALIAIRLVPLDMRNFFPSAIPMVHVSINSAVYSHEARVTLEKSIRVQRRLSNFFVLLHPTTILCVPAATKL